MKGTPILLATSFAACGSNNGIDVDLQQEVYRADFGSASGSLPAVACSASDPSPCNQLPGITVDTSAASGTPSSATVSVGCDGASGSCYAQANARVAEPVDVQLDSGFVGKVEGRLISFVRVLDLTYRVPANTLTFDVPSIDVYVGPAGTTQETDPGAVHVGSTAPIAAGSTVNDGHLPIPDGSGGHGIIENAIRNHQAFVFVLVFSPKIASGQPIPAGMIEADLTPKLTIGF